MSCSKILTARVALGLASDEEVAKVRAHVDGCESCRLKVDGLQRSLSVVAGPFCLSEEDLLRSAAVPAVSEEEEEHLRTCGRCSAIGFQIFHLPAEDSESISIPA